MLTDLLRPFSFLTISHPTRKPLIISWLTPALIAALIVGVGALINHNVNVFGASGLINRVLGFIQSLPGFYIAALAAIATFNNRDMLKLMPGIPPVGTVDYNGFPERVPMTRRRFLSSMFAYLTALSIVLTLFAVGMLAVAEPIKAALPVASYPFVKGAVTYFFLMFTCQMVAVTFWGLYYLGDKLHTPETADPSAPETQPPQ